MLCMCELYIKYGRNAIINVDYLFYLRFLGTLSRRFGPSCGMFNLVSGEKKSLLLLEHINAH